MEDSNSKYIVFIDESGDHSKTAKSEFPIFVLAAVVVERKAYVEEVEQARENIDQDENEKEKPVQSEEPGGEEISEHNYSF